MLTKKPSPIPYSEVTPKDVYLNRRSFIAGATALGATAIAARHAVDLIEPREIALAGNGLQFAKSKYSVPEPSTQLEYITHYNNYYEFGADKDEPAKYADTLRSSPWTITIEGR